jgi:hypothetical protein
MPLSSHNLMLSGQSQDNTDDLLKPSSGRSSVGLLILKFDIRVVKK